MSISSNIALRDLAVSDDDIVAYDIYQNKVHKLAINADSCHPTPIIIESPPDYFFKNGQFNSMVMVGLDVSAMKIFVHDFAMKTNVVLLCENTINSLLLFNGSCFFSTTCGTFILNVKNITT